MGISITKRDGTKEPFNADKINRSIERACAGLIDPISMVTQIATETQLTLYDGMTTEEMDKATINAAVQNIKEDTDYDKVATRLFLKTIYKRVVGDYDIDNPADLRQKHAVAFTSYIEKGVAAGRLHENMAAKFDLKKLADTLSIERDELFQYAGVDGLINRYGMKDANQQTLETPQYFFMRVAMGLSYNEEEPDRRRDQLLRENVASPLHRGWFDQPWRGHRAFIAFQLFLARNPRRHGAYRQVGL